MPCCLLSDQADDGPRQGEVPGREEDLLEVPPRITTPKVAAEDMSLASVSAPLVIIITLCLCTPLPLLLPVEVKELGKTEGVDVVVQDAKGGWEEVGVEEGGGRNGCKINCWTIGRLFHATEADPTTSASQSRPPVPSTVYCSLKPT